MLCQQCRILPAKLDTKFDIIMYQATYREIKIARKQTVSNVRGQNKVKLISRVYSVVNHEECCNIRFTLYFAIVKRGGYTRVSTTLN